MKTALRAGTYSSLNIYFQSNLSAPGAAYDPSSFLLGYCQMPTSATSTSCLSSLGHNTTDSGCTSTSYAPTSYVSDGCNVLAATMPGGAMQDFNQGKTAVHEVGHWFGLLHTFEGNSCASTDKGDFVDDTPQEMTATDGCPAGKDSCPGSKGLDPIGNYMDYSNDAWLVAPKSFLPYSIFVLCWMSKYLVLWIWRTLLSSCVWWCSHRDFLLGREFTLTWRSSLVIPTSRLYSRTE